MKRKKYLIGLGATVLWTVLPIICVLIAGVIANYFDCPLDEGGAHVCVVFGRDIGGLLYTLGVMGWLSHRSPRLGRL